MLKNAWFQDKNKNFKSGVNGIKQRCKSRKMLRQLFIFIFLLTANLISAQNNLHIRGVLPWHNFLSGPTSWNEGDYLKYLDDCQSKGINFIGFEENTSINTRDIHQASKVTRTCAHGILRIIDRADANAV
jgi:hypothetical protein